MVSAEVANGIQYVQDQIRAKHPELAEGFEFAISTCYVKPATTAPAEAAPAAAPAAQLPGEADAGKREQARAARSATVQTTLPAAAPAEMPVEADDARHGATQRGRTLAPGHERDGGDKPRTQTRSPRGAPKLDKDGADGSNRDL